MDERLLTIEDLAGYLNISRRTVYRLLNEGTLPGFRVGSHMRFKRDEIELWLENRRVRREMTG